MDAEGEKSQTLSFSYEFSLQRVPFAKPADSEDAEPQHMSLLIHTLHDGIVGSRAHETGGLAELHFQVIPFRVVPDFYFFGHMVSPALSWSVKYAVTTKASSAAYFTTLHRVIRTRDAYLGRRLQHTFDLRLHPGHFLMLENMRDPLIRESHRSAEAVMDDLHISPSGNSVLPTGHCLVRHLNMRKG